MQFHETNIAGAWLIALDRLSDERGFFARAWCQREFAARGCGGSFVQANLAFTALRGTLRGLHFQLAPHEEGKLVRAIRGRAYVVALDLRANSPTFRRWCAAELTSDNRQMLYVPPGCAQGYQTLVDETEMFYQMSACYEPAAARGVRYDDPAFDISWPLPVASISPRDQSWPDYEPAPQADKRSVAVSVGRPSRSSEVNDGLEGRPTMSTNRDDGLGMHALASRLYPICRSLTGPGVRETLAILAECLPLEIHEVPTGTQVFDWRIPREWRIHDAYVRDDAGRRVIDFAQSNLHVVNYSRPVRARLSWSQLDEHLHSLADWPDRVAYRTSYYNDTWGFCLAHRERLELAARGADAMYEAVIDAELVDGSLSYGELHLSGESSDEVLYSCHVCHPSLANDNLSGIAVATWLARWLMDRPRRLSHRFLFVPATIGTLAWLSRNQSRLGNVKHGLVLTLLGAGERITYKRSRRGDAKVDSAVGHVLRHRGRSHRLLDFEPFGYDERQYCSPGLNLPVGCLMRHLPGEYPEYHNSADDLQLVRPDILADSLDVCREIVAVLEANRTYASLCPQGEPQLGRRGLYRAIGGESDRADIERALLWLLNLADGRHDLLDVADRAQLPLAVVARAAELLVECELIREADDLRESRRAGIPRPSPKTR
jgi:dTDP-4-dehydrorhamnose 3,5-epimerase